LLCLLWLAGCNKSWAPVEDRSVSRGGYELTGDGHYAVRKGDTLHTIAFHFGMDWRDIAAWNGIRSPYVIYPGQDLRLHPPPAASSSPSRAVTTSPKKSPAATTTSTESRKSHSTSSSTPVAGDPSRWIWPTEGRILSRFAPNDPARKGIDIAGKEGQKVVASAAGEVVYSGSGLIGYGELIIIKHSERMLSAYAHNRKRLVAEGQKVKAGDRIAEMGRNDRNQVMLHFEIRVNGSPQDPLGFLPAR
jgi:lipoprotein NlpD